MLNVSALEELGNACGGVHLPLLEAWAPTLNLPAWLTAWAPTLNLSPTSSCGARQRMFLIRRKLRDHEGVHVAIASEAEVQKSAATCCGGCCVRPQPARSVSARPRRDVARSRKQTGK